MTRMLFAAVLALAAAAATPAHATNIVNGRIIGVGFWANFLGNNTVGGAGNFKVALRGRAPFAACFDQLQVYLIAARGNTGYSKGDGGVIRAHLESLDSSDLPSGTAISGFASYAPHLADGYLTTGQTVAGALFPIYTLSPPACLTASQKFAVVFDNVAADPVNNYLGVETLGVEQNQNSGALDPIWRTYMYWSGAWHVRIPGEYHTPIIRLCQSSDNSCILQTYIESGGPQLIGGSVRARQLMTPAHGATTQTCHLTLARATSAATTVRVGLTDLSGAYLNDGSAYADVDISALPVVNNGLTQSPVTATLPAPVTLKAGVQFALQISGPLTGGVWLSPIRDGVGFFATTGGFGGTTDRAELDRGSGWASWTPSPFADFADLQGYCELGPCPARG